MTTATMEMQSDTLDVGLQSRALKVTLHVHAWTNIKTARAADSIVATAFRLTENRTRTGKYLIDPKELKAVIAAQRAVKDDHLLRTLPWEDGGARILSSTGYMDYQKSQRTLIGKLKTAVSSLCSRWDGLVEQSMQALGTLAEISDYPTADDLEHSFSVACDMEPIAEAKDVRLQVSAEEVNRIQAHVELRHAQKMAGVMANIEDRVRKVAERAHASLRDYKPAEHGKRAESDFRDTLVTNVRELADLLPSLNITGSDKIKRMQLDLMEISRYDAGALKADTALRQTTAAKAKAILDKMADYV